MTRIKPKRSEPVNLNLLLLLLFIIELVDVTNAQKPQNVTAKHIYKLHCQPGEIRYFNYESQTKVWGSDNQLVNLRGSLKVRCMESPAASESNIKYLAEILSLNSTFGEQEADNELPANNDLSKLFLSQPSNKFKKERKRTRFATELNQADSINSKLLYLKSLENSPSFGNPGYLKAEPVFEEIAETADRVKRSVSGWFNKTWLSVRDFFGSIFSSSEKSTVSREQAYNEAGIDIGGQCKSSGKNPNGGLPIDDSMFDDLEPKYYIGASSAADTVSSYDFGDDNADSQESEIDHDSSKLSFFDDPKPHGLSRAKRAASGQLGKSDDYDKLLRLPFIFIQSKEGKILEIKFSQLEEELADSSSNSITIKNFKRHLCDLFATNLNKSKSVVNEISPLGYHKTDYTIDTKPLNASAIIKQTTDGDELASGSKKQLVKALAMVAGMQNYNELLDNQAEDAERSSSSTMDGKGDLATPSASNNLSILRSINSTSSIASSKGASSMMSLMTPDIDQIQVRVKQVQQINEGRLIGTAGQLGMSLISINGASGDSGDSSRIYKRSPIQEKEPSTDIAELIQVSTSFAVQMVPLSKLGQFEQSQKHSSISRMKRSQQSNETIKSSTINKIREPLYVKAPKDPDALESSLNDMKAIESRLKMTKSSLKSELLVKDNQIQRLELLKDQIQMRLNEELMRNKMRQYRNNLARQVAATTTTSDIKFDYLKSSNSIGDDDGMKQANDFGFSLTQLIIDNGYTVKRKGSVYPTIEEILQLEFELNEESQRNTMSRLLKDTFRVDKLRQHCRSAMATLDDIKEQSGKLELRQPFNVPHDDVELNSNDLKKDKLAKIVQKVENKNRKRLEQCKQVASLLLKVNDRKTSDLIIDLIDECNSRMLAGLKDEELGYGPTSRYYRQLRQQFTELLVNLNKPSEALLDRLMYRLQYRTNDLAEARTKISSSPRQAVDLEFTYIPTIQQQKVSTKYNKAILREEEDELNNNDGAGSLIMVITNLASKQSIGKQKRVDIVEKLLFSLKSTTCSLFTGPDLDILEAMGNFQEPLEEIVGKIIHLARRCRAQEQYLVACIHGLQGQLKNPLTQKFLMDQLKSPNASCVVKSEIVSTLIQSILVEDLKLVQQRPDSVRGRKGLSGNNEDSWPREGLNQLDESLIGMIRGVRTDGDASRAKLSAREADRKCLSPLVKYYLSRKRNLPKNVLADLGGMNQDRERRSVVNEDSFWDEAQCKRWILPKLNESDPASAHSPADMVDDIDDNSILTVLSQNNGKSYRNMRHNNQRLVEGETGSVSETNQTLTGLTNLSNQNFLRKRQKCTASKRYGPKNAEAMLKAEIVNDLVGQKDENKFLARFKLATNFLGNKIDVGRMYLWHQKRVTRAHVNILGKSLWDTSHSCHDKGPNHLVYMPLFDFNLWLVKVSVGLRIYSEMGFYTNCENESKQRSPTEQSGPTNPLDQAKQNPLDELELYPSISVRASGEASAKFVVARAGMSLASQYGYQGSIKVSRQPESCMSVLSSHQPMNVTFSSWFQLWNSDCNYWGSRNRAEPQATKWKLLAKKPTIWIQDECLSTTAPTATLGADNRNNNYTVINGKSLATNRINP